MTKFLTANTLALSFALLTAMAAKAEMDTDIAGYWYMETPDEKIMKLHIEPNGRFKTTLEGKILESGMVHIKKGKWSMKCDSGNLDEGAFKFNTNRMEFVGAKSGTAKWSRTMPVVPATGMIPDSAFKLNVVPKAKTSAPAAGKPGEKKAGGKKTGEKKAVTKKVTKETNK